MSAFDPHAGPYTALFDQYGEPVGARQKLPRERRPTKAERLATVGLLGRPGWIARQVSPGVVLPGQSRKSYQWEVGGPCPKCGEPARYLATATRANAMRLSPQPCFYCHP